MLVVGVKQDAVTIHTTTGSTAEQLTVNPKSPVFTGRKNVLPATMAKARRLRQSLRLTLSAQTEQCFSLARCAELLISNGSPKAQGAKGRRAVATAD